LDDAETPPLSDARNYQSLVRTDLPPSGKDEHQHHDNYNRNAQADQR
jgi:hypothetical protein